MGDTKSIGIAYRDQDLEGSTITDSSFSGTIVDGGAGTFTNLTATGNVVFGDASTDTVGFCGVATPVGQQAATNQAAVATTAPVSISATQWGFSTSTQAAAVIALQNELRAALVAFGLIKGSN